MKQLTIKQCITMLLTIWLASGCRKEMTPRQDISGADKTTGKAVETVAVTEKSNTTICTACDTASKSYDLTGKQQTVQLKEGNNTISVLNNGIKAVAQVTKGTITQWVLQDKAGKQYLPQSTVKTAQMIRRPGGVTIPIYRICFYLDGEWFCLLVIKI